MPEFTAHIRPQPSLNLHDLLVRRPASTFFLRTRSGEIVENGIGNDDLLVVDRSLTAASGDMVVAVVRGEFVVRRLVRSGSNFTLVREAACPAHGGVITFCVKSFR